MPNSIFEVETESVTDTRATTDKNDPFLNVGFQTRERVGGQKRGKMQYLFRAYD